MSALDDVLDPECAATLMALVRCHLRDGRATVRSVAVELGVGESRAHERLEVLDALGLVLGLGIAGALRPALHYCIDTRETGARP